MMLPGVIAFHLYAGTSLESFDLAYPKLVKDVLPVYLSGFFLAVLLGTVFSSFNSLLNSAATLFCLDIYAPFKNNNVSDIELINVAKIASVVIALFSFVVAPLLMFAPEGLWQIIRIFTGFYNIPVITIVMVGFFTAHVPALAAKVVIIFHVIAYALLKFVFDIDINFIHIYAILFFVETAIMLAIGATIPRQDKTIYSKVSTVNLIPWKYALPVAINLVAMIIMLYILFSPIGLVNGLSTLFWPSILSVLSINIVLCVYALKRWQNKYQHKLNIIEDI